MGLELVRRGRVIPLLTDKPEVNLRVLQLAQAAPLLLNLYGSQIRRRREGVGNGDVAGGNADCHTVFHIGIGGGVLARILYHIVAEPDGSTVYCALDGHVLRVLTAQPSPVITLIQRDPPYAFRLRHQRRRLVGAGIAGGLGCVGIGDNGVGVIVIGGYAKGNVMLNGNRVCPGRPIHAFGANLVIVYIETVRPNWNPESCIRISRAVLHLDGHHRSLGHGEGLGRGDTISSIANHNFRGAEQRVGHRRILANLCGNLHQVKGHGGVLTLAVCNIVAIVVAPNLFHTEFGGIGNVGDALKIAVGGQILRALHNERGILRERMLGIILVREIELNGGRIIGVREDITICGLCLHQLIKHIGFKAILVAGNQHTGSIRGIHLWRRIRAQCNGAFPAPGAVIGLHRPVYLEFSARNEHLGVALLCLGNHKALAGIGASVVFQLREADVGITIIHDLVWVRSEVGTVFDTYAPYLFNRRLKAGQAVLVFQNQRC